MSRMDVRNILGGEYEIFFNGNRVSDLAEEYSVSDGWIVIGVCGHARIDQDGRVRYTLINTGDNEHIRLRLTGDVRVYAMPTDAAQFRADLASGKILRVRG